MKDVTYAERPSGSLALDAYLPSGPGPHPAVLVIPGGKWMHIDKAKNDWFPKKLAERGVAAFSIEYRPSTTAPFPAALEDVQAAVRYVRAHAARFRIDPHRLGAVGGSSGGHLAALLATWGEGSTTTGDRVPVAISWSGPMDLRPLLHSSNGELVSVVETFLGCSSSAACEEKADLASPITHVDPTDGAVYLANHTDEIIPASQARQMAATLAQLRRATRAERDDRGRPRPEHGGQLQGIRSGLRVPHTLDRAGASRPGGRRQRARRNPARPKSGHDGPAPDDKPRMNTATRTTLR